MLTVKELKKKLDKLQVEDDTPVYVTLVGLHDQDVEITDVDDNDLCVFIYTEELKVCPKNRGN